MKKFFDGLVDKIAEKAAKQVVNQTKRKIFGSSSEDEAPENETPKEREARMRATEEKARAREAEERAKDEEERLRVEREKEEKIQEARRRIAEQKKAALEREAKEKQMAKEVDDELLALKKKLGKN